MASESMNETKKKKYGVCSAPKSNITGVVCVVAYPTAAQIRSTTRLIANYVLATTRVERATIKALFIFQVFIESMILMTTP